MTSGIWSVPCSLHPADNYGLIDTDSTTADQEWPKMSPRDHDCRPRRSRSNTSSIPQTRAALSTIASSTGCTSVGERLMMPSTSWSLFDAPAPRAILRCAPEFLEQPDILNGDNGLVGEGLEQPICLSEEWTNLKAKWITPRDTLSRTNGTAKSSTTVAGVSAPTGNSTR